MSRALLFALSVGLAGGVPHAGNAMSNNSEYRFGKKTVHEAFANPRVAALAEAACFGETSKVVEEMKLGVDPNAKGLEGITPLIWAIGCHSPVGVEALLDGGANPNQTWNGGFTAVYAAAWSPDRDATSILKLLLKHGGDPNYPLAPQGDTPLYRALDVGMDTNNWANWITLLDAGADINQHTPFGETIAVYAAKLSQFDKVYELLQRGYRYDLEDLGRFVELPDLDNDNPQLKWQNEVVARLKAEGVRFPVGPRPGPMAPKKLP